MPLIASAKPSPLPNKLQVLVSAALSSQQMLPRRLASRIRTACAPKAALLLICTVFAAGCRSLPASKPEAMFTPEETQGAGVFQVNCARCHYPNTTQGKKGPGLQALTKLKAMPSGAPPTDERLTQTILHGHGMMQAVPLGDDDLHYLLIYLHTL